MPEDRSALSERDGQAIRRHRRAALERVAEHYADLPDDVINTQVSRVNFGTELLGGDRELTEAATIALERNLQRYKSALHDSASPDDVDDGRGPPGRIARPRED